MAFGVIFFQTVKHVWLLLNERTNACKTKVVILGSFIFGTSPIFLLTLFLHPLAIAIWAMTAMIPQNVIFRVVWWLAGQFRNDCTNQF